MRPGGRPGGPHDRDGADRQPAAVHLLSAQAPLRAELPRSPPPRTLPRGQADGLRGLRAGRDRRGDRVRDRPRGRLPPGGRRRSSARRGEHHRIAALSGTAVLSPHLDDAVLSCWHALAAAADVTVINVAAAVPASGHPLPWWDRRTGATESAIRMRERLAEDQR